MKQKGLKRSCLPLKQHLYPLLFSAPTIHRVEEENHHLCCVFFPVSCYLSYDGSVGSSFAYQSVDSGFESHLRLIFFEAGKYPGV